MKKLVFILLAALTLYSCSTDDDSQNIEYDYAFIATNDFPSEFDFGETYTVNLGYTLETGCHQFSHLNVQAPGPNDDDQLEVYFSVITTVRTGNACEDVPGSIQSTSFEITADRTQDYKFYLLTGVNADDEPIFEEIVVPVVEE